MGSELKKTEFKIVSMGSLGALSSYNKKQRAERPEGENELYPDCQGGQYMHSMFSVQNKPLNYTRYPDIRWTSSYDVLSKI